MTRPEDLPLKDIHLPADPSWWPPAPGWWLLLLLLVGLVAGLWWLYQYRQQAKLSAVQLARESLLSLRQHYAQTQDVQLLLRELSVLLRRLSISAFPRVDAAGLTGEAWLEFLDKGMEHSMDKGMDKSAAKNMEKNMARRQFTQGPGRILIDAPYRARFEPQELGALLDLCDAWILAIAKQGRARR